MHRRRLLRTGGALLAAAAGGCVDGSGPSTVTRDDSGTPTVTNDAVDWSVAFDVPIVQTPAVDGGTIYVAVGAQAGHATDSPPEWDDGQGALVALDAVDGAERWRTSLSAPAQETPVVSEEGLYLVTGWDAGGTHGRDQRMQAFDLEGELRWRSPTSSRYLYLLDVHGSRAFLGSTNDEVQVGGGHPLWAVGTDDGRIDWERDVGSAGWGRVVDGSLLTDIGFGQVTAAFDPTDGDREWRVNGKALGDGSTRFQTTGGLTFLSVDRDDRSRFAGVDPSDGTVRWTYSEGGGERFVPTGAAIAGDTVVGTEYGGAVFGLDVDDGTEQWTVSLEGEARNEPVVADGTVYVGLFEGGFHALDASDGTERWQASLRQHVFPAIPAGDAAVVMTSEHDGDPAVTAFDTVNGSERWTLDPGERLRTPTVDEQRAFVGSESGLLRALEL